MTLEHAARERIAAARETEKRAQAAEAIDLPLSAGRYRLEQDRDGYYRLHAAPVDVRFDSVRWRDDGNGLELCLGDEVAASIDDARLPPELQQMLKNILVRGAQP